MTTATKPITIDDYWRMLERGQVSHARVELIGGELIEMSPQSSWHSGAIENIQIALWKLFHRRQYWVRNQATLDLGPLSHPDPDGSVVLGSKRSWMDRNEIPDHAVLVVEVSDSTLQDDRSRKASLYAASHIADYWIVNIPDRQLEVRRDPVADASEPFGFRYGSLMILAPGQAATPLAMPTAQVAVADLLPN
jgi:Uma2 family endonuclease